MEIQDFVYGKEEVNEPVILELLESFPVQRLKKISQYGMPDEYYHKKNYSRYDHSVGVFILLRRLGADIKEQIAGLLHDVSHTAFSHVVDWFIGDPTKEDYQDKNHLRIIENSEIPFILKKYGFDYKEISNFDNFSLLDKDAPSLCVDRVDYTLRELSYEGVKFVEKIVKGLKNYNNQLVFDNLDSAMLFAEAYVKLQKEHWAGDQARARYYILSEALKIAVKENLINFSDLEKTDYEILEILIRSENSSILRRLNLLKKGFQTFESDEGIELKKKFRHVDPEILINESIRFLSEISEDYSNLLENEKLNSLSFKKIIIVENEN